MNTAANKPAAVNTAANKPAPSKPAHTRAAFSLVEILIAVLVLALGLLGLGAVFPVAIAEQRDGEDKTLGVAVGEAALQQLRWVDYQSAATGVTSPFTLWEAWKQDVLSDAAYDEGEWLVLEIEEDTSSVVVSPPGYSNPSVRVPLRDRLFPQTLTPQFVVDAAIHRRPTRTPTFQDDPIEMAVFVRRIDPRVRGSGSTPLFQVLTGEPSVPAALQRLPLAADDDGLPVPGGVGDQYSSPQTLEIQRALRETLEFDRAEGVEKRRVDLATRVGQKLVDNLGNVYEVVAREIDTDRDAVVVRVQPPLPSNIPENELFDYVKTVVFTPEKPAAVFVTRVDR